MKISFKLMTIMMALGLFAIASVSITLLLRSRNSITELSEKFATSMANDSAAEITNFLGSHFYKVETAAHVMEQFDFMILSNRRKILTIMLEGIIRENPDIIAAWCVFEPDILEGNDRQQIGVRGSNAGGRFAPYCFWDNGKISTITLEDFDDPAYTIPRNTGLQTIMEPYEYVINKKTVIITSITAPIRRNNKVVGVVGFDIPLNDIQRISQTQKPFPDAVTAVFSNNGSVVAHFDESRVGKDMRETEVDMAGKYLTLMTKNIKDGKSYTFTNYVQTDTTNMYMQIFSVPIKIGTTKTPWSYAIAVNRKTILAPIYEMLSITLMIGTFVLLIIISAAVILSRSISKPIVKTADTLKDISEGEGDLTRSITVNTKDEVGNLAMYFNKTLEKIRNLVIIIKKEAANLSNTGNELASNMTETASAINEITANIQSLKNRVLNQSASVSETHATMEQVVSNINKLNGFIENQSKNVTQASSAVEQMAANINSVTETLVKNTDNVKTLKEASEAGKNGLQEMINDIQEIAAESEGLLEINSVMENISSQTNLLSMNAAIEAAHAGDAGRGFAVVADEIRKLAENSSEQSKIIGGVLKKMKNSIDKVIISSDSVNKKFEAIDSNVKIVSEEEENILSAMEEQGRGSRQILEVVGNVNEITRQVKDGSKAMLEGANEVIVESNNLEKTTHEITGGMNEMASGAEQINTAVHHVNEISSKNHEGISTLIREVSRFKV